MNNSGNPLFPIFVKIDQINILVVGGGYVGTEKVTALLNNDPDAHITVVAREICQELKSLVANKPKIRLLERPFMYDDLTGRDLLFLATDNHELHIEIKAEAQKRHLLTNVADTPAICDFYLGSTVKKGDLKIGISTNGKSPTLAKRIKEYLNEALPDNTQSLLDNLKSIRDRLKGDMEAKIKALDAVTEGWLKDK
ncbi:bifunctional precorrin-2 dehydrogenase/sirohydrochlorin ferrochelatase [Persicobacter psychrovividus]|uniref:precorrin-2 dehydrogenase n=1 Tax=Persicobacter psychrovividus TaxID=387638 RepID=A0ABN6LF10_9BACT|nr:siroheme synthase [Persicobacter psychrovividus]